MMTLSRTWRPRSALLISAILQQPCITSLFSLTLGLWVLRIGKNLVDQEPCIRIFLELCGSQLDELMARRGSEAAYLVQRSLGLFLLRDERSAMA
jgi:hypothetical protein